MTVLLNHDILEICTDTNNFLSKKKIFDIVYNPKTLICFTENYINLIEKSITNLEGFQALLVELSDTNRITKVKTLNKKSLNDEFVEISLTSKISTLIPIIYEDSNSLVNQIPALTIFNKSIHLNKHWITLELLTNNFCNVCYLHFKKDKEISEFFNNVFRVPNFIREVYIFDREQDPKFLTFIKGKHIHYYTFFYGSYGRDFERKNTKKNLRGILGGKLKLYFTSNPRVIHERKIIFDNFIISIDNSQNNLTVLEPTWEITITFDIERANKWKEKCTQFKEVME